MASLSQQITNIAVRMAQECNLIRAERGPLLGLTTTQKTSIVSAINELVLRLDTGATGDGVQIKDTVTALDSTWSSSKIAAAIAEGAGEGGGSQIDDNQTVLNMTWSSSKINTEIDTKIDTALDGIVIGSEIEDTVTALDSTWSSSKIADEIDAASAGALVIDDTQALTTAPWSGSKVSTAIAEAVAALPAQLQIDDAVVSGTKVWSSTKTNSQINVALANALEGILDDEATRVDATWSSSAIAAAIADAVDSIPPASSINDATTATTSTWSSSKITSHVNTEIAAAIATVTKTSLGLGNVENKSSATIRGEITQANVTAALGGTPLMSLAIPVSNAGGVVNAAAQSLRFTGPKVTVTNSGSQITVDVAATSKADVGLSNVDNVSDANKPVSTAQAAADAATLASAKVYADSLVVGLWDDRGNYNASTNLWPETGGSGAGGAVERGDIWTVSTGGTLGGVVVSAPQTLRALIDLPGQTNDNWAIGIAGTAPIDDAIVDGQVNRAPSQNAVYDALALKQNALSAGTAAQYRKGDNTVGTLDKTAVGLANVENLSAAQVRAGLTAGEMNTAAGFTVGRAIVALDEGVNLTSALASLNFVGSGVTATQAAGAVTITIPGGTGAVVNDAVTNTTNVWSSQKTADGIAAAVSAVTKNSLGLGNVENKSGAVIRSEMTRAEVETAVGFTIGGQLTIKDEGTNLTTAAASINFVGAGVTATTSTGAVTVTIPTTAGSTDDLPEGTTNKYFTEARARNSILSGYSVAATNAAIAATDPIVIAFGKTQKQLNDIGAAGYVTPSSASALSNKTLVNPVINGFTEGGLPQTNPGASATMTNAWSDWEFTITQNCTINWPAPEPGRSYTCAITQGGAGNFVITHAIPSGTLKPENQTYPAQTLTAGRTDLYVAKCNRAGTVMFIRDGGRNF